MLRSPWSRVTALALAAGAVWVPFAWRSLSPDEGGLLLLADQWSPGSSLYGDYFVDRPPLLIALFALADAAGGAWAMRALGVLSVVVDRAARGPGRAPGRSSVPHSAPVLPAATAAVLVTTPLFGATVVNGELLGLPFLLGGAAAALAAARSDRARQWAWGVLAGVSGAAGVLVKQSLLDVFVLLAVLLLVQRRLRPVVGAAIGAVATVAIATWLASLRGTDPGDLWDAVFVFRQQAAAVIADSATYTTPRRFGGLAARPGRQRRPPRRCRPVPPAPTTSEVRRTRPALAGGRRTRLGAGGRGPGRQLLAALPARAWCPGWSCSRRPRSNDRHLWAGCCATSYAVAAVSTVIALVFVLVAPDRPARDPGRRLARKRTRSPATPPWSPSAQPTSSRRPACPAPTRTSGACRSGCTTPT